VCDSYSVIEERRVYRNDERVGLFVGREDEQSPKIARCAWRRRSHSKSASRNYRRAPS
jgi:hypothetical protein